MEGGRTGGQARGYTVGGRTLPVTVAWSSSDDNAIHYVLPVLQMTSCSQVMEQAGYRITMRLVLA